MIDWKTLASYLEGDVDRLASAGNRYSGDVQMADAMDGQAIGMPTIYIRGAKPGPKVWINGSIHGNEVLSTQAVIDVIQAVDP